MIDQGRGPGPGPGPIKTEMYPLVPVRPHSPYTGQVGVEAATVALVSCRGSERPMGCQVCKPYSSAEPPVSEEEASSVCKEDTGLLSQQNGYGIARLDSPSPERKPADGEGNYAATSRSDRGGFVSSHPPRTSRSDRGGFVSSHPPRTGRRDLVGSREVRGSLDSTTSSNSRTGSYTTDGPANTLPLSLPYVNVVANARGSEWARNAPADRGISSALPHSQNRSQPPQPFLNQLNRQKKLQLGGLVEADRGNYRPPQSTDIYALGPDCVKTKRGKEMMAELQKAYRWREKFSHPTQEFLALMDRLYMECQLHLTALASRGDAESKREADAIVNEMVAMRNYWGPQLLPSSTCNAFVRERISLTLGVEQRQFRIDCAQFFEPVPFYGNQQNSTPGELMKLYRFSVYNVSQNEVVLRYYLERSNVIQMYHVLCFTCENYRGQVKPYGTDVPSYWEVRQNMLEDVYTRLLGALAPAPGTHPPPKPLTSTTIPPNAPSHIPVSPAPRNT